MQSGTLTGVKTSRVLFKGTTNLIFYNCLPIGTVFVLAENSLLNYRTTLCNCILPYVVVFVIVIVLYKYICFDLRATVGCFVASNLASLPQRLFLNVHVWDSRYIKTYPSHSACELSDPGGVQVSLMSSFKSICW